MPEPPFRPDQPDQQLFSGFGPAPIPDPRDELLDGYLATLRDGGPPAVAEGSDQASELGRRVLLVYGERAAARAVRERSVELVVSGLVAVVVGGLHRNERGAFLPMALLDDATARIGAVHGEVFDAAAEIVGNPGDINLMIWLGRAPQDRTPKSMGFVAADAPDGFRYVWS